VRQDNYVAGIMFNVVILGRPGSGKGTQASRIEAQYGLQHLSTGEMLRTAIRQGTPLGRQIAERIDSGNFVSDELAISLVKQSLLPASQSGHVFDGVPRNVVQAPLLSDLLEEYNSQVDVAIELSVDSEIVRERLLARASREGRVDDTGETISHRLSIYETETAPLIDYYRQQHRLMSVDGTQSPDRVFGIIQTGLNELMAADAG
jgi:adenylate kinase